MGGVSTGAKYTVALQFNGTGAQTVGGSGGITALGGNSSPSTAITISNTSLSGVTFGANVNTTNGGGVNATTTVNANALVKFSSSRIQFTGGGSLTFNGLTELQAATFNSHYAMIGTKTIGTGSTITYKNSASTITPTTDIPSATLGNLAIDVGAGSATLGNTITISGNLTLASGTLSAGANNINLAGNWANAGGMFSGGTGTVTLNGTNQSITGSTTFNNLTKQVNTARTLTFDSTGTQTITGTMTLQGVSAQLLSLRSSNNGSQWTIDPQGARTIALLDVKDSDNINATAINAVGTNSVDSGNNTNWVFIPVTSVDSVMTHGIGGTSFPVHLLVPIGSPPGIECRSSTSQGAGNYTMVFTFPNNLTSVAGATVTGHNPSTAHGMVSTSGIDSNDSHNYIVNLTGVSDQQYLAVTLNSVVDAAGNAGNVTGPKMGILIGDVNASGHVDAGDIGVIQQYNSQTANSTNFRADVNVSGHIDAGDVGLTQQHNSTGLPTSP
jgi:hypothetical protein